MSRDGTATRERLLDAAEELTLEHGFAGASIGAILRRAGSSKGAFFHHFAGKEALGTALVERHAEREAARLRRALERAREGADARERLLRTAELLDDDLAGRATRGSLFAAFLAGPEDVGDETRAIIEASYRLWRTELANLIARAAFAHRPRARIDPVILADQLIAVNEGALLLARGLGDDPDVAVAQMRCYRAGLESLFAP